MEEENLKGMIISKEQLKNIIKHRINYIDEQVYDGFDMSGYGNAPQKNTKLLSRFDDLIKTDSDDRYSEIILPVFWKGNCNIIAINRNSSSSRIVEEYGSGETTLDILTRIIELQNIAYLEAKKGENQHYGERKFNY